MLKINFPSFKILCLLIFFLNACLLNENNTKNELIQAIESININNNDAKLKSFSCNKGILANSKIKNSSFIAFTGCLQLVKLKNSQLKQVSKLDIDSKIIDISNDSKLLAYFKDDRVSLVDLSSNNNISEKNIDFNVSKLKFLNSSALIIGSTSGKIYIWDFAKPFGNELLELYNGHNSSISQIESNISGASFFTADWNGNIIAWVKHSKNQSNYYDYNIDISKRYNLFIPNKRILKTENVYSKVKLLKIIQNKFLAAVYENGYLQVYNIRGANLIYSKNLNLKNIKDLEIYNEKLYILGSSNLEVYEYKNSLEFNKLFLKRKNKKKLTADKLILINQKLHYLQNGKLLRIKDEK